MPTKEIKKSKSQLRREAVMAEAKKKTETPEEIAKEFAKRDRETAPALTLIIKDEKTGKVEHKLEHLKAVAFAFRTDAECDHDAREKAMGRHVFCRFGQGIITRQADSIGLIVAMQEAARDLLNKIIPPDPLAGLAGMFSQAIGETAKDCNDKNCPIHGKHEATKKKA